jgi:hypothetical protein
MNNTRLIYAVFSVIVGVLLLGIWSNIQVYAQQPLSTANSPSTTTISPELKAKMCDPGNPSLKVVNTTEAHICGIQKTVKNMTTTAATPPTSAVSSSESKSSPLAASLTAPKQQKMIASNNNNIITPAASQLPKQTGAGKETTTATVAPVRNVSNKSLSSSPSTIAPQVNAITKQQQQQQLLTVSNVTAGQNHTFAATSPVVTPGQLIYLGYQGSSTASDSSLKDKHNSDTTPSHSDTSSSASLKDKHSSHIKSSSHNDDGSKSSSNIENDISSVIMKSFNFKHSRHSDSSDNGGDSFFGVDSFFNSNHHIAAASLSSSASAAAGGGSAAASSSASASS